MSANKKRLIRIQKARESQKHLEATRRIAPHSWMWNLPVGLAIGSAIAPLSLASPEKDLHLKGESLAIVWSLSTSLTACAVFLVTLSTARSILSGRPFLEGLKWMRSQNPLGALSGIVLSTLTIWLVAILSKLSPDRIVLPVTILMGFVSCHRALSLAYRDHYLTFVLSPSELNQYKLLKSGKVATSKPRLFFNKSLNPLWEGKRHKLLLPVIQTMLVLYTPSILGNLMLDQLGYSSFWYQIPSLMFLVLSTWIWGRWHLYGGMGNLRVFPFWKGRSMLVQEKR